MTPKEQTRLQVLNSLLAEHMTLDQAATLMGVSTRHTRRMLAAYREQGAAAVGHGHRGRKAPNAIPDTVAYDVVHLARTRYSGANHTCLSESLNEREGIDIGRTTLRRILANSGLKSPRRRRPPKHRLRRQRMPRQGMLIQIDSSYHPRGRWNHNLAQVTEPRHGSIPAWAGEPRLSRCGDPGTRVYPRVGGPTSPRSTGCSHASGT